MHKSTMGGSLIQMSFIGMGMVGKVIRNPFDFAQGSAALGAAVLSQAKACKFGFYEILARGSN